MNIPRLMACNGFTPEFIKTYYAFHVDGTITVKAEAYRQSGTTEKTWVTKSRNFKEAIEAHERIWPIEQLINRFNPNATETEAIKTFTGFMLPRQHLSNEELLREAEKEFSTGVAPTDDGGERSEPETPPINSSIQENEPSDTASNISSNSLDDLMASLNPPAETNAPINTPTTQATSIDDLMAIQNESNQTIDDLIQNAETELTPEEAVAMMSANSNQPKQMISFGEAAPLSESFNPPLNDTSLTAPILSTPDTAVENSITPSTENELTLLKQQLAKAELDHDEVCEAFRSEIKHLQDKLEEATTSYEESINELQTELTSTQFQLSKTQAELDKNKPLSAFEERLMNNSDLPPESRMQTSEERLNESSLKEIERLKNEIESITTKLHDVSRERNEYRAESTKIKAALDAYIEQKNDPLKIDPQLSLEAFQAENKNLAYRVKQSEEREKLATDKLIEFKDENVKLQKQNDKLNETVLNLKNELDKLNEQNLLLTSKLAEQAQETSTKLEEQNQQLTSKVSELGSEIVTMEETINLLRQTETAQENKIFNLEETIKKLQSNQSSPEPLDQLLTQPDPAAMQIVNPEDDLAKQLRKQKIAEARQKINLEREERHQDSIKRGEEFRKRREERAKYDSHALCQTLRTKESLTNADEPKPVTRSAPTITPENEIKFTKTDNGHEINEKWKAFVGLESKASQIAESREAQTHAFA